MNHDEKLRKYFYDRMDTAERKRVDTYNDIIETIRELTQKNGGEKITSLDIFDHLTKEDIIYNLELFDVSGNEKRGRNILKRLLISVVLFQYYRDTEAIKEALKSIKNCNCKYCNTS